MQSRSVYGGRPAINTSQLTEGRRTGALAMKVGMIPLWDKWGERHATTVLHLDECQVIRVMTEETDGYTAMQLGVGEKKLRRVKITEAGQYLEKANSIPGGIKPKRKLMEFRISPDSMLPVGTKIQGMHFVAGQLIDVCGISKGKGFQGVMKRHNFRGGPASHGTSRNHRKPGSTGCRQDPGRTFKNKKMPGRMGSDRITTQNLKILKIDPIRDLIYVKGIIFRSCVFCYLFFFVCCIDSIVCFSLELIPFSGESVCYIWRIVWFFVV
jgi:large subunit ribosomal protein L3